MIIKLVKSIQSVSAHQWNALTRGPFFSHEWFQFIEAVEGQRHQFYYFLAMEAERLVGVIPAFVPLKNDDIYRNFLYGRLHAWIPRLSGCGARPLICYGLGASGKNLLSDQEFIPAIIPPLIAAVRDLRSQENISDLVFLFVRENEADIIETLETCGFSKVFLSAAAILQNRFDTFDDYLRSLSRNGKNSVKGDLRRFRKFGCTPEVCAKPEEDLGVIAELVANIEKKYPSTLTKQSLRKLKMAFRWMTAYRTTYLVRAKKVPLGTITFFIKDDLISTYAAGLDYRYVRASGTYFYLFYYLPVQEMINRRAPYLNFNHMAYRVKESRGAKLVPQFMFVKSLKPNRVKPYWFKIVDRRYRSKFNTQYNGELTKPMHANPGIRR